MRNMFKKRLNFLKHHLNHFLFWLNNFLFEVFLFECEACQVEWNDDDTVE